MEETFPLTCVLIKDSTEEILYYTEYVRIAKNQQGLLFLCLVVTG